MKKPLQLSGYSVKPHMKCLVAVLFCFLLLGITGESQAQVYYLLNSGAGNTSDVVNSVKKVDYNGSNDVTVTSSIPNPALVEVDAPNNRIFAYAAYANSRIINVLNMTTGALINTISVPEGIQTGSASVSAIKYDPINDWVYYITNSYTGTGNDVDAIWRSKPNGTQNTALARQFAKLPLWLALDIPNNRVFVYDGLFSARKMLTFDLTTNTVTASATISNIVNAIDYDPVTDYIYYITSDNDQLNNNDANGTATDALRKIRPNGEGGEVVIKASLVKSPQYMALDAGNNRAFIYNGYYGLTSNIRLSNTGIYAVDLTTGATTLVLNHASLQNTPIYHRVKGLFVPARPMVTTSAASGISSTSATLSGNVTRSDANVTARGVVYSSTNSTPTIGANGVTATTNGTGTGAFTASLTGLGPVTTYYVRAYATSGAGTAYGAVSSFSTISNNTNLSNLTISSGTLSPVYSAGTTSYTASVAYNVTSVTLTPIREQANATIEIAGTPVTSGTASAAYNLNTGTNTINTVVTAQDGTTKKTYTIMVTRAQTPQTITFAAFPAKTYGDGNFGAGATVSSGQSLTYASDNTAVATIDNTGSITIKGAGTANITASQAGNSTYLAATPVTQVLTIAKATLTYTADTTSRDYGAANPTFTGTISGFKNGETQATATTGTMVFNSTANATSNLYDASLQRQRYPITGSGLTAANYTFAQAATNDKALGLKRVLVTYTFRTENHVYDGKDNPSFGGFDATFTGTVNGHTANQLITFNYATTATAASGIGVYPIQLTNVNRTLLGYNYDFAAAASNATALTITKANLTFTAQSATKRYGEANPTITGTITGFVNNQSVASLTGTPAYSTTATTASGVGNYPITLSGVSSNNYTITAASANSTALSITKSTLTYVADPASRAFNNANPALTGKVTGFLNGDTQNSATSGTLAFTTAATPSTPVGAYAITGSGLSSANYDFEQSAANNSAFSIYLSTNGNLSNVVLSSGTLSPLFAAGTNNYTAEVSTGTTAITVTPTLSDANAKVTVNGSEVTSGSPSAGIPLVIGANVIPVNVTAQNGTTTNPYNITVTRLPSDDAEVTSITSSTGTMIPLPGYDYAYIDTVANNVTSVNITAVKHEANATLSVFNNSGEAPLTSGTPFAMPLNAGSNVVNVLVTAQDGTTKKYNNVHVVRRYSTNNLLKSLAIAGKSISPAFSSANKNYTLNVDNLTTSVDVSAAVADSSATFSIEGIGTAPGESVSQLLDVGENNIRVRVFAQSGANTVYTIKVTRAKSPVATLANLGIITPGTIDKPFNNDSLAYEYHVASTEGVLKIKPVATNSGATIKINDVAVDPNFGYSYNFNYFTAKEPVVVVVTSQDSSSTKTFTISAVREFASNAYLSELSFLDGTPITPAFDKNVYNYTATISDPTRSSTFLFQKSEEVNAEVKVNFVVRPRGTNVGVQFNSGENIIPIVGAQNGTENLYTLKVTRAPGVEARLSGVILSGNGGSYSNVVAVNMADTVYNATIPNNVTTLNVSAYASDNGAEVKINGVLFNEQTSAAVPINLGDNVFAIAIRSADGSATKNYTLHVNRLPFADVSLASLTISKGIMSPVFAPGTTSYTVPMGSSDTSIVVTPVAASPTATITIGVDTISATKLSSTQHLFTGTNTINIRVTAADGVTNRLYRVRPNVPFAPNANLYNIKLSKGAVSPVFTAANTSYTAAVSYSTSSIGISPLALEAGAVITVNGITVDSANPVATVNLNAGPNIITTIVTAPDASSTKTYTLTITRAAAGTNAALASVYIDNGALSPAFSSSTSTYTSTVDNAITAIKIAASVIDTNATIDINGTAVLAGVQHQLPLVVGENIITVTGTAEDGVTKKAYTFTITRATKSSDATLANIYLDNGTLSPVFASGSVAYNVSESNATTFVSVLPVVNNVYATIKVNGIAPDGITGMNEVPLSVGTNTIIIEVMAEDSITTKTYTLTVTRASDMNLKEIRLSPNARLIQTSTTGNVEYSTTVSPDVTSMILTPFARDAASVDITINGTPINSGEASAPVALNSNPTVITFVSADKFTTKTKKYTITVNKTGSNIADLSSMTLDQNAVAVLGVKVGAVINYSASVPNGVNTIKITPLTEEAHATVKINGTTVANKTASGAIALNASGSTVINVVVTAQDGVTIRTYALTVNKAGSNNAFLAKLKLSTDQVITTTTLLKYTIALSPGVSTIMLTPTVQESHATVKINAADVANNTASGAITISAVGTTNVNVMVTAGDGITTRSYTIAVSRTGSTNAKLSQITLSPGSKIITSGTVLDYAGSVSPGVSSITLTPLAQEATAIIRVNGNIVASGTKSGPIVLNATGTTPIAVDVTAENGTTIRNYTVTVSKTGSDNAGLSLIKLYDGATQLTTSLESTYKYSANVANSIATVKVKPTAADATATIKVNGVTVANNALSQAIPLSIGDNTITVVGTAQNGIATKTYTMVVTRSSLVLSAISEEKTNMVDKPDNGNYKAEAVIVHQALSPNGDGINDVLQIDGLAAYPQNSISIMNAAGVLVYQTKEYDTRGNVFNGYSNSNTQLKPGTYLYVLEYVNGKETKRVTGYIILKY
jgi:gliding motility-associated-like protein